MATLAHSSASLAASLSHSSALPQRKAFRTAPAPRLGAVRKGIVSASLKNVSSQSILEREVAAMPAVQSGEDALEASGFLEKALLMTLAAATPLALFAEDALATNGELGILEGRSFALLHPIIMGGLLFATLYAGYLGWQFRRTRTIAEEISELKKLVPAVPVEGAAPSEAEAKIKTLSEERKELVKGNFREKHWNIGSLLLAFGVFIAIEGCFNTFIRTGRLFPGPHLYAGAGIVVLWAAAAALVPAMQKGDNNARNAHIALNGLNVLLFLWQVPTGLDIVGKVFQFTSWP